MRRPGVASSLAAAAAALAAALLPAGCRSGPEAASLIDPDAVGCDQGTLVSIGDIRSVAQAMIQSMNDHPGLARLRSARRPLRIALGKLKQRTSIAIFDKEVFLNRLLSSLSGADLDGAYAFLRRESIPAGGLERAGAPAGADLVLDGEIREILHREPEGDREGGGSDGGGLLERRTVQYTLTLTRVDDAAIAWTRSHEVVKQQVTGAVYQ